MSLADLPAPTVPPDEVRRITEEVLARAEYAEARPSLLNRIANTVLDLLAQVIELLGGGGRGSVIGTVVLVVASLAVVAAVVWFARRVRRDPGYRTAETAGIGRTPADWHGDAQDHEAAGRWREALRCHYRGLIAELAAAGLVDEVPGRTSGEYADEVTGNVPAAAGEFAAATRAFEAAWYGAAPVTAQDVRHFREASTVVARAAGVGRRREPAGVGG